MKRAIIPISLQLLPSLLGLPDGVSLLGATFSQDGTALELEVAGDPLPVQPSDEGAIPILDANYKTQLTRHTTFTGFSPR